MVVQGFYINVDVYRGEAAHYDFMIANVQTAVPFGTIEENISENIEGRERHPSTSAGPKVEHAES